MVCVELLFYTYPNYLKQRYISSFFFGINDMNEYRGQDLNDLVNSCILQEDMNAIFDENISNEDRVNILLESLFKEETILFENDATYSYEEVDEKFLEYAEDVDDIRMSLGLKGDKYNKGSFLGRTKATIKGEIGDIFNKENDGLVARLYHNLADFAVYMTPRKPVSSLEKAIQDKLVSHNQTIETMEKDINGLLDKALAQDVDARERAMLKKSIDEQRRLLNGVYSRYRRDVALIARKKVVLPPHEIVKRLREYVNAYVTYCFKLFLIHFLLITGGIKGANLLQLNKKIINFGSNMSDNAAKDYLKAKDDLIKKISTDPNSVDLSSYSGIAGSGLAKELKVNLGNSIATIGKALETVNTKVDQFLTFLAFGNEQFGYLLRILLIVTFLSLVLGSLALKLRDHIQNRVTEADFKKQEREDRMMYSNYIQKIDRLDAALRRDKLKIEKLWAGKE